MLSEVCRYSSCRTRSYLREVVDLGPVCVYFAIPPYLFKEEQMHILSRYARGFFMIVL